MKRKIVLICIVLFMVYPLARSEQDFGPLVGFKSQGASPEYHLNYTFGVEQWENGKLTKFRHQQWRLLCAYPEPSTGQQNTWCSLERLVIDKWDKQMEGAIITTHKHYSSEETLKLLNVDWQEGKIDFSVVYDDSSTTEVMFRFKTREDSLYLDSFKAVGIARGALSDTMTPIEYKIPPYTYILNVPVEMGGFKSMDEKKWDDMFTRLSKQDQIYWEEFKPELDKCINVSADIEEEQILKEIIPNYETRNTEIKKGGGLTPEEKVLLDNYIANIFTKCLDGSNISPDGKKKILLTVGNSFKPFPTLKKD